MRQFEKIQGKLAPADILMYKIFSSIQLKSGYLVQQLSVKILEHDLKELKSISPGLSFLIETTIAPLLSVGSQLGSVIAEKMNTLCFPFTKSYDFSYCYPLKLSVL